MYFKYRIDTAFRGNSNSIKGTGFWKGTGSIVLNENLRGDSKTSPILGQYSIRYYIINL